MHCPYHTQLQRTTAPSLQDPTTSLSPFPMRLLGFLAGKSKKIRSTRPPHCPSPRNGYLGALETAQWKDTHPPLNSFQDLLAIPRQAPSPGYHLQFLFIRNTLSAVSISEVLGKKKVREKERKKAKNCAQLPGRPLSPLMTGTHSATAEGWSWEIAAWEQPPGMPGHAERSWWSASKSFSSWLQTYISPYEPEAS